MGTLVVHVHALPTNRLKSWDKFASKAVANVLFSCKFSHGLLIIHLLCQTEENASLCLGQRHEFIGSPSEAAESSIKTKMAADGGTYTPNQSALEGFLTGNGSCFFYHLLPG